MGLPADRGDLSPFSHSPSAMRRFALFVFCSFALVRVSSAQAVRSDTAADPYRWLEDVNGSRAMTWVKAENAKTVAVLEKDPRFAGIYKTALAMAQAKDRIPYVSFMAGALYNFWQDSAHVRGIWRRTTLESYRTASPVWTTVLDLDALARAEKANWVWHGADCEQPAERRCLLMLSDGGEDASTVREFDVTTRAFVKDGFNLPRGKQNTAWMGLDTLLVSREWKPGEMTASGYPYVVKRLVRGQALANAVEVFRGEPKDVSVGPGTIVDGTGHRLTFIDRGVSFFESEKYLVRGKDIVRLNVPAKAALVELIDGQAVVRLSEEWKAGPTTIRAGSLASFDVARANKTPDALAPVAIYEPGPRESVDGASATKTRLLVGITQNVKGRVMVFTRTAQGIWSHDGIALPDNASTSVASTDSHSERAFIDVAGYLTPSSVWLADASRVTAAQVKTLAPRFDASRSVVEQFEAASKDGTKVPYFIVHPKGMKLDGSNPTILTAYGGFEVSVTPHYDANAGKLWVEQGGVYVTANIRGGGEFGPAWHEAGLKTQAPGDLRRLRGRRAGSDRASHHQPAAARYRRRLERRPPDGRRDDAASGALERRADRGAAPGHDALRADRGRRVVGGRVRQRVRSRRARVPREHLATAEPQARREVSGAVHLDDDQGRSRRSAARAEVRGEDGGHGAAVSFL